jgi:hypothetical protein
VLVLFLRDEDPIALRCLRLVPPVADGSIRELVGWLQTPDDATHLVLMLPDAGVTGDVEQIVFHDVSERDPKCHPLANVPRWDTHRPPFPIERVYLPESLAQLGELIEFADVQVLPRPASRRELSRTIEHAACVLDPTWVPRLKLKLADVERLAAASWLIVDLDTIVRLLRDADAAKSKLVTHEAPNGLMSARVEYSDVPTRGFALQDVLPYSVVDNSGGFRMRALRAGSGWRRYADRVGFATLLSSETPWTQKHGDVLSAMRAVGKGELIVTDLPWLVAGRLGRLAAPKIATHLLRMHVGEPLADHLQYWNRWEDGTVVVRDISDLARRYTPLRPVRWASPESGVAHLGMSIMPAVGTIKRHVMIRTGRIDTVDVHDGIPPEPMVIFMKWLAREVRENTVWARRHMAGQALTWQFDTHAGLKYSSNYLSAQVVMGHPVEVVDVRMGRGPVASDAAGNELIIMGEDEGLFGDSSLEFQADLAGRLLAVLERDAEQPDYAGTRIARGVG